MLSQLTLQERSSCEAAAATTSPPGSPPHALSAAHRSYTRWRRVCGGTRRARHCCTWAARLTQRAVCHTRRCQSPAGCKPSRRIRALAMWTACAQSSPPQRAGQKGSRRLLWPAPLSRRWRNLPRGTSGMKPSLGTSLSYAPPASPPPRCWPLCRHATLVHRTPSWPPRQESRRVLLRCAWTSC